MSPCSQISEEYIRVVKVPGMQAGITSAAMDGIKIANADKRRKL